MLIFYKNYYKSIPYKQLFKIIYGNSNIILYLQCKYNKYEEILSFLTFEKSKARAN